jgi:hypothetical protein
MATAQNLMAYGMASPLARRMGRTPVITSACGATSGLASLIGGAQYLTLVTITVGGSSSAGLVLPQIGGQVSATSGALLGDDFFIQNNTVGSILIFAANNALGSAVTLYGNAASAAGTTGISAPTGQSVLLRPITVSTWVYMKSIVSA